MVMRNQHGGGNSPGWWDDLPPKVRERFGRRPAAAEPVRPPAATDTAPHAPLPPAPVPAPRPRVGREVSKVAVWFLAVAVVNMVVLLLALAVLRGGDGRFSLPLLDPLPAGGK